MMNADVVIIGGSFAGFAAALQLARAQRQVVVIDANRPRNRFAEASHGVFGLDGKTPQQIREQALLQLRQYPTFSLQQTSAIGVEQTRDGFAVLTEQGVSIRCKKLILAMGIQDQLPDIADIERYWGKSVAHCPYCHGYELRDQALGVLASNEFSLHQAMMLPDWGPTTLFTQGQFTPSDTELNALEQRGVRIETSPIVALKGDAQQLSAVILEDGRSLPLQGLFVAPKIVLPHPLIEMLALELETTPHGDIVRVDALKESSLAGVFVAGDLSNPMQSATLAIASGAIAGVAAHRSLIFTS
ncbi:NAD(P)/FAD-dependent oxidoreductase [Pseudoalteromonas fenneropenaei]|uniref:NAD(P)/FAD-dependent oxidoreductase n=1 Tax=Pseudoalteromonas fenneropenaei TaxID=1737459 RepID=A0ABV7CI70_9GAMM